MTYSSGICQQGLISAIVTLLIPYYHALCINETGA